VRPLCDCFEMRPSGERANELARVKLVESIDDGRVELPSCEAANLCHRLKVRVRSLTVPTVAVTPSRAQREPAPVTKS